MGRLAPGVFDPGPLLSPTTDDSFIAALGKARVMDFCLCTARTLLHRGGTRCTLVSIECLMLIFMQVVWRCLPVVFALPRSRLAADSQQPHTHVLYRSLYAYARPKRSPACVFFLMLSICRLTPRCRLRVL